MNDQKHITDITIIGGGPVGMFAAFYAGLRQVDTKIIESLPVLGGQPNILYPEKNIYDIAGYPSINGAELTAELEKQMAHFKQTICTDEKVEMIEKKDDYFTITTNKNTHYSKTIIITIGQGSFKPRRLPFDYSKVYEEHNLDYVVRDLSQYKDKKVAVLGGGDSAVDWALALDGLAQEVYLIHRRNKFRALESSVEQLKNSGVNIMTPYFPTEFISEDSKSVDAIKLSKPRSDESFTLDVDAIIVNFGFISSMEHVKDWGVELDHLGIKVDQKMQTNVEGIFAAGDIAQYDGKIKLITVGFGEAPTAVNHAVHLINPDEHTQPIQSTKLDLD